MNSIEPKKIAMLVSGGVDSAVALDLLVRQGHDITLFYTAMPTRRLRYAICWPANTRCR